MQVEILDFPAGERFPEGLPVSAGIELAFCQDRLNLLLPGGGRLIGVGLFLKGLNIAPQIAHGLDHLTEGLVIFCGIVLDIVLIVAPGGQIAIGDEAVVRQMPCPAMAQVHDGVFAALVEAVRIDSLFRVIRRVWVVTKNHRPLTAVGHNLIKIIIGVVDYERGCTREIAVCPGVSQNVHGDAHRLETAAPGKLHCVQQQIAVGAADQAVLVAVSP